MDSKRSFSASRISGSSSATKIVCLFGFIFVPASNSSAGGMPLACQNCECEGATFAVYAVDADDAAMHVDQFFRDRQAKADTLGLFLARPIDLVKFIEYLGSLIFRNSRPRIANADGQPIIIA